MVGSLEDHRHGPHGPNLRPSVATQVDDEREHTSVLFFLKSV